MKGKAVNTYKLLKKAGEIFPSVDTLAFTFGNVIMGKVGTLLSQGPFTWRIRLFKTLVGSLQTLNMEGVFKLQDIIRQAPGSEMTEKLHRLCCTLKYAR